MSDEVNPVDIRCGMQCVYCYETTQREARNGNTPFNLPAILSALEQRPYQFSLHGGEPLLARPEHLEALWSFGLKKHGRNGVQTNGHMINEHFLDLFKRYKVHVGFSVDGPGELNDARWAGTVSRTRLFADLANAAILRCIKEKVDVSVIVTLTKHNALGDRLFRLIAWLNGLATAGLRSDCLRLHLMEVDSPEAESISLTDEQNVEAMKTIRGAVPGLKLYDFYEIRSLLLGRDDNLTCVWNACDPYTTPAVQGIDPDGSQTNCARTNKNGVSWRKARNGSHGRQLVLYDTPQEHGGCRGCRFFFGCKGHCPGDGLNRDWRQRTRYCRTWFSLFETVESELVAEGHVPVSLRADLPRIETELVRRWERGETPPLQQVQIGRAHV